MNGAISAIDNGFARPMDLDDEDDEEYIDEQEEYYDDEEEYSRGNPQQYQKQPRNKMSMMDAQVTVQSLTSPKVEQPVQQMQTNAVGPFGVEYHAMEWQEVYNLADAIRNIALSGTKQPLSKQEKNNAHAITRQLMLALPANDEGPEVGVPLLLDLKKREALQGLQQMGMGQAGRQQAQLLSRRALVEHYSADKLADVSASLPAASTEHSCSFCGTTRTPEWRRGPAGPKTLCNACGLHYSKLKKKNGQQKGSKKKGKK